MSVPMVGPGPLEGGPKKSPGSAKSGDSFSARFKHACDQSEGKSASSSVKPSADQPEKTDAPSGKKGSGKSDVKGGKGTPSSGSRRLSKGKTAVSGKGEQPFSNDAAEPKNPEGVLQENPEGPAGLIIIPNSLQVTLGIEKDPVQMPQEGEIDPTLLGDVSLVGSAEPTTDSLEQIPKPSQNSETKPKEDPVNNDVKPQEVLPAVLAPVLINLASVLLTEPTAPVGNETSANSSNEDPLSVTEVSAVNNAPAPVVLQGPMPVAGPDNKGAAGMKTPDPNNEILPKVKPEPTQKSEKASLVPAEDAKDKTVLDRPTLGSLAESPDKAPRPEPQNPSAQNQGKDLRKDTPVHNEGPRAVSILHPEIIPTVSLTTDVAPKLKETPGIAPMGSGTVGRSGGETLPLGNVTLPVSPPVSEARPTESVRPAAPVVSPSPVDIAQQIHVHLESGRSVVRIDLHPEHLGELRISMETKGKDVTMQFTVDNDNARHAVVAGLREITGTLSSLGWSVNGLAVNVSSGGVGNGRGEANGPLWGTNQNLSNTLPTEPVVSALKQGAGEWRVDLVA